jgi:hypothetical protein
MCEQRERRTDVEISGAVGCQWKRKNRLKLEIISNLSIRIRS